MPSDQLDLLHMFLNAGLMVQFVLVLLIFFSMASWTIILLKIRQVRRAFIESGVFIDFFWKSKDLSEAFVKAKEMQYSPIAKVFRIAFIELKKNSRSGPGDKSGAQTLMTRSFNGMDNIERSLQRAIDTEITQMMKRVPFLATTGNTTPFIGLFGTVWGIMNSFHGIGMMGSASLAVVAPGISEALVATATGLAVAIPSVIAYNYFSQKIRVIETELRSFSADLMNIIDRDIMRGGEDES